MFLYFLQSHFIQSTSNYGNSSKKHLIDEMSYGSDTWYMGRIYEELKNYACVWLISICIIN